MYFQALREFGTQKNQSKRIDYMLSSNCKSSNKNATGAGEENRTPVVSLEGWGSTIELHLQLINKTFTIIRKKRT